MIPPEQLRTSQAPTPESSEGPELLEGAAAAGPKAAGVVAWLEGQLESERQELERRHGALVRGLAQALAEDNEGEVCGAGAPRAGRARAARGLLGQGARAGGEGAPAPLRAAGEEGGEDVRAAGEEAPAPLQAAGEEGAESPRSGRVHKSDARVSMFGAGCAPPQVRPRSGQLGRLTVSQSHAPRASAFLPWTRTDGSQTSAPEVKAARSTAELTQHALRDRGLDVTLRRLGSQATLQDLQGDMGSTCRRTVGLLQRYADKIIRSPWFDYCMSVIIVANCVTIGLEIQEGVGSDASPSPVFQALENCFLVAYVLEISARVLGDWKECLQNAWFRMDLTLVVLGVVTMWILEPLLDDIGMLDKVLVIRILRLVRLVRALRFLKFIQPLWKLVKGLVGANGQVSSAGLLLFVALYVFACGGVALLADDGDLLADPVAGPIVADRFRSIPVLMLTLIQFAHCDNVSDIYHPLIRAKPSLILYFLPLLLVVPIALMNLVTAVIVTHAMKVSTQDAEFERISLKGKLQTLIPLLTKMFRQFDVSGTGFISFEELDLTKMTMPLPAEVLCALKSYKLEDFFRLLDADASGHISQSEWVDGMCCLILDEVPIESLQMLHMLSRLENHLELLKSALVADDSLRRQSSIEDEG